MLPSRVGAGVRNSLAAYPVDGACVGVVVRLAEVPDLPPPRGEAPLEERQPLLQPRPPAALTWGAASIELELVL